MKEFKSFEEEREFWENNDSTQYIDWSKAKKVRFTNLKKTTKSISLRLPADLLEKIKVKANALNLPYQAYIKTILYNEVAR